MLRPFPVRDLPGMRRSRPGAARELPATSCGISARRRVVSISNARDGCGYGRRVPWALAGRRRPTLRPADAGRGRVDDEHLSRSRLDDVLDALGGEAPRVNRTQEVAGSSPASSTRRSKSCFSCAEAMTRRHQSSVPTPVVGQWVTTSFSPTSSTPRLTFPATTASVASGPRRSTRATVTPSAARTTRPREKAAQTAT
jgi:hypothetical protein